MSKTKSNSNVPAQSSAASKSAEFSTLYGQFHCSAEWHLCRCTSKFAPILYSWGRRVAGQSERFYASVESIADHFGCDRTTVMRAFKELHEEEWAQVVQREDGKPVVYRFVDHDEWAPAHPGRCTQKETMPWEGQGDPLGKALYTESGGRAKFLPRQMNGLRKFGFSDDQVVAQFRVFLAQNPQTGSDWNSVYYRFQKHLRLLAGGLSKVVDAKNSRSEGSHACDTHQSHRSDTPCRTHATPTSRTGATQVVEVRVEREVDGELSIPALHSQGRRDGSRGMEFSPSKPAPKSKTREDDSGAEYEALVRRRDDQKHRLLEKYPKAGGAR